MVTISDVAREAGVSLSTASRALNNSSLVSQEKKDRIADAVKKLNYKPLRNTAARKSQQNKIIILITSLLNAEMIEAIRHESEKQGYQMVLSYAGDGTDGYSGCLELVRMLPSYMICGIILVHNECPDKDVWRELSTYPNVQIGEYQPCKPLNCIMLDDYQAAYEMTGYLIEKGHKNIAYVNPGVNGSWRFAKQRYEGFQAAMKQAGIPTSKKLYLEADYTLEGGADIAQRLLNMDPVPDAVFCGSDQAAAGCVVELNCRGVKVPEDIAVCGFDNFEISEVPYPKITTIAQPFDEMGMEAVRMLDMMASGTLVSGRKVLASHTLIERGSA